MHTFLRHATTGQYFQDLNRWTLDREDAHDFGLIAQAMRFARKLRIPGLELIIAFEEAEQVGNTPFEVFWRKITQSRHRVRRSRFTRWPSRRFRWPVHRFSVAGR